MKAGVVRFPGSNCDFDAFYALHTLLGVTTEFLWHKSHDLAGVDLVILPGGFSYGDYLRSGAIAARSPIMREVISFARGGGMVLGICNGFQVLTESGLLPGALIRNTGLRFSCRQVFLKVESLRTPFTRMLKPGDVLQMPIAHGEGNYYAFQGDITELERQEQVVFRYTKVSDEANFNPNGSVHDIAGICNREGNVVGLMPHPERAVEEILGSTDGLRVFQSAVASLPQRQLAGG